MAVCFEFTCAVRLVRFMEEAPQIPRTLVWQVQYEVDQAAWTHVGHVDLGARVIIRNWLRESPVERVVHANPETDPARIYAISWLTGRGLDVAETRDEDPTSDHDDDDFVDDDGASDSVIAEPGSPQSLSEDSGHESEQDNEGPGTPPPSYDTLEFN